MPIRATHRASRDVKGWGRRAPKTMQQRRKLLARCGRRAFLIPGKLSFPVVAKTGGCAFDCEGLRAAKARAAQMVSMARRAGKSPTKYKAAERKAERLGARANCHWAR